MPLSRHTTTCTQNDCIADGIYEIRFTKPEGFDYHPGHFVMWDVPLCDNPDDIQPRAYSIASTPEEEDLLFVIKMVENGRCSKWVSEKLEPGTELQMQGPLGNFKLHEDDGRDLLFVCTATGNAPFRSMIKDALEKGDKRRMDMIFGVRNESDLFWLEEFENMAKEHENFHFHIVLSKPSESWTGHTGHVQDIIPEVIEDPSKVCVHVCGNPNMTTEMKKLCMEKWGIEKKDVHVEGYV